MKMTVERHGFGWTDQGACSTMTGNSVRPTDKDVFSELRYVWLFQCSCRTALHAATFDRTAGNLPSDVCRDGKWTMNGQLVVGPHTTSSIGIDLASLKAGIEKDGFYLWSADWEPQPDTLRSIR
jgi:hypothetical protein